MYNTTCQGYRLQFMVLLMWNITLQMGKMVLDHWRLTINLGVFVFYSVISHHFPYCLMDID